MASGGGEDQRFRIRPDFADLELMPLLLEPVTAKRVEDRIGSIERTDGLGCLRFGQDDGPVLGPGEGAPDVDRFAVEVHIGPRQARRLAGAKAEVQHRNPHRFEWRVSDRGNELLGLVDGHRAAFLHRPGFRWKFDDRRNVSSDKVAADAPLEDLRQRPADLRERRSREPGLRPISESLLDPLRAQRPNLRAAEVVAQDVQRPLWRPIVEPLMFLLGSTLSSH